jgi:PAS domain S-box-containing protein
MRWSIPQQPLSPWNDRESAVVCTHTHQLPQLATTNEYVSEAFRLAIEATPTGVIMVSEKGTISLVNAQIEKLFGYARHELVGQSVEILVPQRVRANHGALRAGFSSDARPRVMGAAADMYGVRKDGSEVAIEIGLNPLPTPKGIFVLSSIVDLTERKLAAQRLSDSLQEKDLLLKELQHRVKNNLQVISSLLSLHAGHASDPKVRAAFIQSQERVHSIALVHEKLYQSPAMSRVRFSDYARELTAHLVHSRGAELRGISWSVEESPVQLSVDACIMCGLVVNELVTNSLKHAFSQSGPGRIEVGISQHVDPLVLCVRDDGVGLSPGVDPQRVKSLGLGLVATFASRLYAELNVERDGGTAVSLSFFPR